MMILFFGLYSGSLEYLFKLHDQFHHFVRVLHRVQYLFHDLYRDCPVYFHQFRHQVYRHVYLHKFRYQLYRNVFLHRVSLLPISAAGAVLL